MVLLLRGLFSQFKILFLLFSPFEILLFLFPWTLVILSLPLMLLMVCRFLPLNSVDLDPKILGWLQASSRSRVMSLAVGTILNLGVMAIWFHVS